MVGLTHICSVSNGQQNSPPSVVPAPEGPTDPLTRTRVREATGVMKVPRLKVSDTAKVWYKIHGRLQIVPRPVIGDKGTV